MIPVTRKELYLNKIVGNDDYSVPEKPISEEEFFFAAILGEAVQTPEPLSRYQIYLAKIAGRNISVPKPLTRLELFLAKACGMDIETPTPITREEIFWAAYMGVETEIEGVPPLTFTAKAGTLSNYRIYGNTVNGESVGDRTANLFANLWKKGYIRADNGREEQIDGFICSGFFPVEYGQTYSISRNINVGYDNIRGYRDDGSYIGAGTDICDVSNPFPSAATNIGAFTVTNENVAFIRFNDSANDLGMKYMIVEGTYTEQTMPDYEPYGYEVPVTINNVTTNLYLPEPLKMVGNDAEYVDFVEQKQYFADGTSISVNLPTIFVSIGMNTICIETKVVPSGVRIKGKFKKITTTYVQSIEPDNTNNKIIFVVRAYLSKNDRMVRTGLVATNDPAIGVNINVNSTVITSGCKVFVKELAGVTPTTDDAKYTWAKTNVTDGEIWYIRSYVEYINSDNEQLIIYSDAAKASLDGII